MRLTLRSCRISCGGGFAAHGRREGLRAGQLVGPGVSGRGGSPRASPCLDRAANVLFECIAASRNLFVPRRRVPTSDRPSTRAAIAGPVMQTRNTPSRHALLRCARARARLGVERPVGRARVGHKARRAESGGALPRGAPAVSNAPPKPRGRGRRPDLESCPDSVAGVSVSVEQLQAREARRALSDARARARSPRPSPPPRGRPRARARDAASRGSRAWTTSRGSRSPCCSRA